jgi:hypothetical protein
MLQTELREIEVMRDLARALENLRVLYYQQNGEPVPWEIAPDRIRIPRTARLFQQELIDRVKNQKEIVERFR